MLVILESPYAGDVEENLAYARSCMRKLLFAGMAPIASHLLYTQPGVLDDSTPAERSLGITAGLRWRKVADLSVFCAGRGWSQGMLSALESAKLRGAPYIVIDGSEP
jgi:hypothetical protein